MTRYSAIILGGILEIEKNVNEFLWNQIDKKIKIRR